MRKFFTLFSVIILTFVLSACSNNSENEKILSKEGVAPYELSESDTYLLESLGLSMDANIISFKAPKTAKSLEVNVYVLNDDNTWNVTSGGLISLGQDADPDERLEGTFTMLLKDNYAIDFNINTKARASFNAPAMDVDFENMASLRGFLTDFQKIEINKEIPVALMIYDSGTSMRSHEVEDFFTPSIFEDLDLIQAITLTFTDGFD